jgi:hypothetical protein
MEDERNRCEGGTTECSQEVVKLYKFRGRALDEREGRELVHSSGNRQEADGQDNWDFKALTGDDKEDQLGGSSGGEELIRAS